MDIQIETRLSIEKKVMVNYNFIFIGNRDEYFLMIKGTIHKEDGHHKPLEIMVNY